MFLQERAYWFFRHLILSRLPTDGYCTRTADNYSVLAYCLQRKARKIKIKTHRKKIIK